MGNSDLKSSGVQGAFGSEIRLQPAYETDSLHSLQSPLTLCRGELTRSVMKAETWGAKRASPPVSPMPTVATPQNHSSQLSISATDHSAPLHYPRLEGPPILLLFEFYPHTPVLVCNIAFSNPGTHFQRSPFAPRLQLANKSCKGRVKFSEPS